MKESYFRYLVIIGLVLLILSLFFPWVTMTRILKEGGRENSEWFFIGYRYHYHVGNTDETSFVVYYVNPTSKIDITEYGSSYLLEFILPIILIAIVLGTSSYFAYPNKISAKLSIITAFLIIISLIFFGIGISDTSSYLLKKSSTLSLSGKASPVISFPIISITLFIIAPIFYMMFDKDKIQEIMDEIEYKRRSKKERKEIKKAASYIGRIIAGAFAFIVGMIFFLDGWGRYRNPLYMFASDAVKQEIFIELIFGVIVMLIGVIGLILGFIDYAKERD